MSKKVTDANSILGVARRAHDVPRPQASQSHTTTSPQEHTTVTAQETAPPERRVNVAIRASTHKALKLLAVQQDRTVQDLVDELAQAYLSQQRPS
ncbi:hypothetical protein DAETH_48360 (plasmid) [Deinococcus aetherius]|uniref:Uncharacterized protein n=1 Tax=Deinococcus aetherius TaxID=200252 RepID=A0ABM8AM10_9DEIO|nr:hypothetical protein [Deinococcus aetherius]BDP44867.1 hypothetical protein DAETH_48360 [Deinococcus aetherius]